MEVVRCVVGHLMQQTKTKVCFMAGTVTQLPSPQSWWPMAWLYLLFWYVCALNCACLSTLELDCLHDWLHLVTGFLLRPQRLLDVVFKLAAGCASMVLLAACSPWLLGESVTTYTFVGIVLVSVGIFQYFQPPVSVLVCSDTVACAYAGLKSGLHCGV
jgi:hypothetical protein